MYKFRILIYFFEQFFPSFIFFKTFSNSLTLCRPLGYLEGLVIHIWSRTCQKLKLFYTSGLVCTVYNPHMCESLNVLFQIIEMVTRLGLRECYLVQGNIYKVNKRIQNKVFTVFFMGFCDIKIKTMYQ